MYQRARMNFSRLKSGLLEVNSLHWNMSFLMDK